MNSPAFFYAMKRLLTFAITLIWLLLMFVPIGSLPTLGPLLHVDSGYLRVQPPENGPIHTKLTHDRYRGQVLIDSVGIPHIYADDNPSAFYLLGYMHARDRIFQMELMTRMMEGQLSGLVGANPSIERLDRYWIQYHFGPQAASYFQNLAQKFPKLHERFVAYSEGVNTYLEFMPLSELPEEYRVLETYPRKWQPWYFVLLKKYMSYTLSHSNQDLFIQDAINTLNDSVFHSLYPLQEPFLETVIPEKTGKQTVVKEEIVRTSKSVSMTAADQAEIDRRSGIGSNNWVLGKSRTHSGEAILANDMHLGLSLPPPWYEVHLKTPELHQYGLSIPAGPVIVAGFTERIAWGFTNSTWDLMDLYKPVYAENGDLIFGRSHYPVRTATDTIWVKGGDPITVLTKTTDAGPIIEISGNEFLVDWVATRTTNELKSFDLFERARGWDDFVDGTEYWKIFPQNIIFADSAGNIGIYTSGDIPDRKGRIRGVFASNDTIAVPTQRIPHSSLPHIYNPEKGYIESANQRQIYNADHYYSWKFADPFRGYRIANMMRNLGNFRIVNVQSMQADIFDSSWPLCKDRIVEALVGDEFSSVKRILSGWNGQVALDLVAPTYYEAFKENYYRTLMERFGAPDTLIRPKEWVMLSKLLGDSVITSGDVRIDRDELIRASMKAAITELQQELGDNRRSWFYGNYHQTQFYHIGRLPGFSPPPFRSQGNKFTVNVARGRTSVAGPSHRTIVEMTTPIRAKMMVAGGQSGRASSRHFMDQIENWRNVRYHDVQFHGSPDQIRGIRQTVRVGRE